MPRHIGWLSSDDRRTYSVAKPEDEGAEARLKKILAMLMRHKEAHANGEHAEVSVAFCPACKKAARDEVREASEVAARRMARSEKLANFILRHPEKWEKLKAVFATLNR